MTLRSRASTLAVSALARAHRRLEEVGSVLAELEQLTGVDGARVLVIALTVVVVFTAALTWPVCRLLLALYRRSVRAGMRRGGTPGGPVTAAASAVPTGRRIAITPVVAPHDPPLLHLVTRRARRAQVAFGAAGFSFGITAAAVLTLAAGLAWLPVRTLTLTLVLGCLVVPSVIAQGVASRKAQLALYAGYAGLLLGLPVLGGTSVLESFVLAAVLVALPSLFVLATGLPAVRGAAWLVAPALALIALTGVLLFRVVLSLWLGVRLTPLMWALLGSAGCLLAAGVAYGWAVTALHTRKWTSEQTLLVLQWWAALTLSQVLFLAMEGPWAAMLALCPFAVLVTVLVVAAGPVREDDHRPVRLLLLRTFGARRRSSRLLRGVTSQWRWIGSVELITAPDVATEVVEPREFLDFLRRRLPEHFVADPRQVPHRVAQIDLRPDRDGRYRVNDLLCHDDTWQPTVQALLDGVDAVLMDLRGLTRANTGVLHEIESLVASFPLDRVVALVDRSTDRSALQEALDRAATIAPASSPLHQDARPALRVVELTGRRADVSNVLASAAQAAASSSRAAGTAAAHVVPQGRRLADESQMTRASEHQAAP